MPRTCPHPTAFATHTLEQMLQQGCWEPAEQPRCERGRTLQRRRLTCTAGAGLLASAGTAHAGSALTPCSGRKLSSLNSVSWQLKQTEKQTIFYRKLSSVALASAMQKITNKLDTLPDYLPQPTHLHISLLPQTAACSGAAKQFILCSARKVLISETEIFFQPSK